MYLCVCRRRACEPLYTYWSYREAFSIFLYWSPHYFFDTKFLGEPTFNYFLVKALSQEIQAVFLLSPWPLGTDVTAVRTWLIMSLLGIKKKVLVIVQ